MFVDFDEIELTDPQVIDVQIAERHAAIDRLHDHRRKRHPVTAADHAAQDSCRDTEVAGLPQCALPGCRHGVHEPGLPCGCCLAAFGNMLQERPAAPDVDSPPAPPGGPAPALAATAKPLRRDLPPLKLNSAVKAALSGAMERKQGQTCWLCTERRTCTKEELGWECDECRKIT